MLSVNLTTAGWPVLVVGGGRVGRRKATAVVAAGATVTVVDPRTDALTLPPGVLYISQAFQDCHLDGVKLAFACATPAVNAAVVAAAQARGVWVCSASDPAGGDFVLPSVARRGDLTFAVSTGGASPALAKRIAAELLTQFDDTYAEWVRVLGDVRAAVLRDVSDATDRRRLLDGFADPMWLERIRTMGADVVTAEMMKVIRSGEPAA